MRALVEVHYYDGGFVSEIIPGHAGDAVPDLPRSFGLKSHEAEIVGQDTVIEFVDLGVTSPSVCWLGLYRRGRDYALGDRGGYCGVGVWLIGASIKHGQHFLNLLGEAADQLACATEFPAALRSRLSAFARDLPDLDWCAAEQNTAGLYASRDLSIDSTYLRLEDNSRDSRDLVGIDILCQTFLASQARHPGRRVYFLAGASRIFVPTQQLAFTNALTYAEDMIHRAQRLTGASDPDTKRRAAL